LISARVARKCAIPALLEALAPHVEDDSKRAVLGSRKKKLAGALALA
jgi:hypothetical protein